MAIPGASTRPLWLAAGGALGIAAGAGLQRVIGGPDLRGGDATEVRGQIAALDAERDAGLDAGTLTVRREAEIDAKIEELDDQVSGSLWPIAGAGLTGIVAARQGAKFDSTHNFRWETQKGEIPGIITGGSGSEYERNVRMERLRFSPGPSIAKGAAIGLVAGAAGMFVYDEFLAER